MKKLLVAFALTSVVVSARPVAAQTPSESPIRGWIAVDILSVQSQQDAQTYNVAQRMFSETARFKTDYPALPRAIGPGFTGGFTSGAGLGFGFRFLRTAYEYEVGLSAIVPHPLLFARMGTDSDLTQSFLQRNDRAFDLQASYTIPTSPAVQLRVFGGPTFFQTEQGMVESIRYTQAFNLLGTNAVNITNYTEETATGSGWGFNGGFDLAGFFSRHVGAGGGLTANRGTVTVTDPFSGGTADLKTGTITFNAGLRLRF